MLTLAEFEEWLVAQATTLYHRRQHTGIDRLTPLRKWEIGIFGNTEIDGVGMPPRPTDRLSVLLDFLPFFERTVQSRGVTIEDRSYYAEALRPWISSTDPKTGDKRKFVFRRDPRDISAVWFFDPDLKQYFKIPFAEQSLPAISLWEYRRIRDRLAAEGRESVNDFELLTALTDQRNRIEGAKQKSKKARREAQRRAEHEKQAPRLEVVPEPETGPGTGPAPVESYDALLEDDIEDFGDFG